MDTDRISRYLLHPYSSGLFGWWLARRKPYPGDHCELGDVWVFTDFWRAAGIGYPDQPVAYRTLRLAGLDMLPQDGPSL